jgi:hypothetical protein
VGRKRGWYRVGECGLGGSFRWREVGRRTGGGTLGSGAKGSESERGKGGVGVRAVGWIEEKAVARRNGAECKGSSPCFLVMRQAGPARVADGALRPSEPGPANAVFFTANNLKDATCRTNRAGSELRNSVGNACVRISLFRPSMSS